MRIARRRATPDRGTPATGVVQTTTFAARPAAGKPLSRAELNTWSLRVEIAHRCCERCCDEPPSHAQYSPFKTTDADVRGVYATDGSAGCAPAAGHFLSLPTR